MGDSLIHHQSSVKVPRNINIILITKESGRVSFRTYTNKDLGSITILNLCASSNDRIILVGKDWSVLTLGNPISEDEDPVGVGTIIVFGEYSEVGVDHWGEVEDKFGSAFLKSDLSGIGIAVGIVGRNGTGNGRGTFELTKSGGGLYLSCAFNQRQ
jgi:hypothetical protein